MKLLSSHFLYGVAWSDMTAQWVFAYVVFSLIDTLVLVGCYWGLQKWSAKAG